MLHSHPISTIAFVGKFRWNPAIPQVRTSKLHLPVVTCSLASSPTALHLFVRAWLIKNVVSRYIINGSYVYGCASKAFNLVDHNILFRKLLERGLPLLVVRFLLSWYSSQECRVRWGSCLSDTFRVSNGVRQGSVLSPLLFAVYLDGLLSELVESGVGCYWKNLFAGCLRYADDIVLLAPCPSALRIMLNICCNYASCYGLEFNTTKSQLICFRRSPRQEYPVSIYMNGNQLQFSDKVYISSRPHSYLQPARQRRHHKSHQRFESQSQLHSQFL